jgi:hypothetical protein
MNQDSSRSHSIFTVTVETSAGPCAEQDGVVQNVIRMGKLNLVHSLANLSTHQGGITLGKVHCLPH